MMEAVSYIFDDTAEGRSLVVTGSWSRQAAESLKRGEADGLVLNYARGFSDHNLDFLDASWGLRRLKVLDRAIEDLTPIGRLAASLEGLSVQAAPPAELDLGLVPRLRVLGAEWGLICRTLGELHELRELVTWRFEDQDLHAFRDHVGLRRLRVKDAPRLESLDGIGGLPGLEVLIIVGARRLRDISDVAGLAASLAEFELEGCPLRTIDDVAALVHLRFLGVSDCREIESLAPIRELEKLEILYAWGSTRIVDCDLSPLAGLPLLKEVRMRDRREYRPRVGELVPRSEQSTSPSSRSQGGRKAV
jgi:hypothetical protein